MAYIFYDSNCDICHKQLMTRFATSIIICEECILDYNIKQCSKCSFFTFFIDYKMPTCLCGGVCDIPCDNIEITHKLTIGDIVANYTGNPLSFNKKWYEHACGVEKYDCVTNTFMINNTKSNTFELYLLYNFTRFCHNSNFLYSQYSMFNFRGTNYHYKRDSMIESLMKDGDVYSDTLRLYLIHVKLLINNLPKKYIPSTVGRIIFELFLKI